MENRKRNVHLHVMVTPDELAAIHERMAEAGNKFHVLARIPEHCL